MVVVESLGHDEPETVDPRFSDDLGSGSACSTPFVSAPSSPGRGPPPCYFFSAPSSPMHYVLCSSATSEKSKLDSSSPGDFEFDFSSRLSSSSGPLGGVPMTSAEELFSNGQIKPMKLSSHLQRPQILSPLLDLETEEEDDEEVIKVEGRRGRALKLRSRSVHRKARSLSPLRNAAFQWNEEEGVVVEESHEVKECIRKLQEDYEEEEETKSNENVTSAETTPSCSASSSRSSSYGRNSKKWIFIKDLLHRSKSEGRGNGKDKFWSNISFSPSTFKEKKLKSHPLTEPENAAVENKKHKHKQKQPPPAKKAAPIAGKPTNGIAKRRGLQPSAHEVHYTTNRAQAEEMKKRTYLPYRHGLFGCLGFSSKGYGALNGLARSLNPVSSG